MRMGDTRVWLLDIRAYAYYREFSSGVWTARHIYTVTVRPRILWPSTEWCKQNTLQTCADDQIIWMYPLSSQGMNHDVGKI